MKKIIALLMVVILGLSLCACESKAKTSTVDFDTSGHLVLNSELIELIKEEALSSDNELKGYYVSKILSQAKGRISIGDSDFNDMSEFTSISSITSSKQIEDYYYHFYCKLYGVDNFNREKSFDMYVSFYCELDENGEYEVIYDGFSVD